MLPSRSMVGRMLLAILVLQCSVVLCANRSDVMSTSTHVDLQVMMAFVEGARGFNTSLIPKVAKKRT